MLDSRHSLVPLQWPSATITGATAPSTSDDRQSAISRLQVLEEALEELRNELVGIGHNQPPEPIHEIAPLSQELASAGQDIRQLKEELLKDSPDISLAEEKKNRILALGLKIANWVGERLTKFTDAALVTLAPVVIVKATNILPVIADAIAAVTRFLKHLPY